MRKWDASRAKAGESESSHASAGAGSPTEHAAERAGDLSAAGPVADDGTSTPAVERFFDLRKWDERRKKEAAAEEDKVSLDDAASIAETDTEGSHLVAAVTETDEEEGMVGPSSSYTAEVITVHEKLEKGWRASDAWQFWLDYAATVGMLVGMLWLWAALGDREGPDANLVAAPVVRG